MGSASSLGRETLHTSLAESYPHIIRPKTPPTTKPGTTCRKAAPKSSGTQSDVSFAVYRPILPIIAIGSEGGTVPVTAWVHAQLRTAARFDDGVTIRQLSRSAGETPHPKTYTFCYHHTGLRQGEYTPISSYIPPLALHQCRQNLYCFRVEEQGVWT